MGIDEAAETGRPPSSREPVKLWFTAALIDEYVAEDEDGRLWLIAASPLGPEAWDERRPYEGDHELKLVQPQALALDCYRQRRLGDRR